MRAKILRSVVFQMHQVFWLKKRAPYMVVLYRSIIDSDFEMIAEKMITRGEERVGIFDFYIFLFRADPSKWSAQFLRTIHKL